jgi:hypothetical protein
MPLVYLAEIVAYDPAIPGTVTLRYASQGWAGAGAPGFYDGRIMAAPVVQRTAFAAGTTSGLIAQGFGELRLANPDGGLDALGDYGFDGRAFTLLVGDSGDAYSAFTTLLRGTMEQPTFTDTEISLRIRDRLAELDRPLETDRYAGTNSGSTGQEGTADDIKGQVKPRVFGRVLNVTPRPVNVPQQVWQVSDGAVAAIPAVYEGGLAITAGAAYASLADMTGNAPAAGTYRAWAAGGMFRLGSAPTLAITADVDEGAGAGDRTTAQVLQRIATGPGGIASGDVVAGDVTALDAAAAGQVGIYADQDTTVLATLDAIANSVGAWCGFDRLGQFRMRRLEVPAGSPVATFRILGRSAVADATTGDIIALERLPTDDDGRGVPAYRVTMRYGRNWTPLDGSQVAGAVTQARRAYLAEEWRSAIATDATVQTKHLRARELSFDSLLVAESDAQAEATRRQALYGVRRDRLRLRTLLTPALASLVDLGAIVRVEVPRYGYTAGRLMVVLGITYGVDPVARPDVVDLDLWG